MKKNQIKEWVKEAIKKDYTLDEIVELLNRGHYDKKEIEEIVLTYHDLKKTNKPKNLEIAKIKKLKNFKPQKQIVLKNKPNKI